MNIDFIFGNVRAYNLTSVQVKKGETFYIASDLPENSKWFFDNDQVLSMKVLGKDTEVIAEDAGESTILLMDAKHNILGKLFVEVVDKIELPASKLEIEQDLIELKQEAPSNMNMFPRSL